MPQENLVGSVEAFEALIHPEDRPAVTAALGRLLDGTDATYRSVHRLVAGGRTI